LHWLRNTDEESDTVTFTALGGYDYRKGLRKLGFEFDGRERCWRICVPCADQATIDAIERFLRASEKIDKAAARWRQAGSTSDGGSV
jgi:hypothetical protein